LKAKSWKLKNFRKIGRYYYNVVRGIHHGEVKPNRIQKSVAVERPFGMTLMKMKKSMKTKIPKSGTRRTFEEKKSKAKP
jgi:hypothetical protein